MNLHECTIALATLAKALGATLDGPTFRAYHQALSDVPAGVFEAACMVAARAPRQPFEPKFPTAPTLRQLAEGARRDVVDRMKWAPCEACIDQHGWVTRDDGRVERCACWKAHQQRIATTGLATPLALPAPEPAEEVA
jgi:hypothetical protein